MGDHYTVGDEGIECDELGNGSNRCVSGLEKVQLGADGNWKEGKGRFMGREKGP